MKTTTKTTLALVAVAAMPVGMPAMAQEVAQDGEVLTTVYAPEIPAIDTMVEGPDIEGFISARRGNRVQVTSADGTSTIVTVTDQTTIKARGGFLGLGRETLGADALLNGLPVKVATRQWEGGLVASDVRFSDGDLETAEMIRSGTNQRFADNEMAIGENTVGIEKNAAATEALRGRFGDIDQYNIKSTTNVYFDTGRHNLSQQARAELCDAAAQAEATDNALLLVVGYTDSTGSYEVNQELSERRAGRVVNYLQQQCGWKPWRMLSPTGMAEADPAADNSTAYGKAQNRRVAVNVLVSKSVDGLEDERQASR
ncbi:cell envelope biogenesis protein OmpA [Erythrobacter sp. KY5]|uniref:OmpA family protein n=1 Tax=Erythrobacter sp. KY5 TaxID=2011159 RepID=UPI000DBF0644|nr:OmpA family protein [Erythrobacter sp. KY5]AWW73701.1 cell envelope biogenesis protein OmpA [Erythrobacter sp. KY5]